MIREWLRAHRARIEDSRSIAARTDRELERVKAQRPRVEAHRVYAIRELQINHVGQAVLAMIQHAKEAPR